MFNVKSMIVLVFVVFFVGCASASKQTPEQDVSVEKLISQDLVGVLAQIQTVSPQTVSLLLPHMQGSEETFSSELKMALRRAGYSMRSVDTDAHSLAVSYSINRAVDITQGEISTYTVNVGSVGIKRAYQINAQGKVSPVADMQVRGTDASLLTLNNDLFKKPEDALTTVEPPASEFNEFTAPALGTLFQTPVKRKGVL